MNSLPVVTAGILLSSTLLAGCLYLSEWETVHPEELDIRSEPDQPAAGDELLVTASAPVVGRIAIGTMSFAGSGSQSTSSIGTTASLQTDTLNEDELIAYWAGAWEKVDNTTEILWISQTRAVWTGDPTRDTLTVRIELAFTEATDDERGPQPRIIAHVEGTEEAKITWMSMTKAGSSSTSVPGPHAMAPGENGTHHAEVRAPEPTLPDTEDAPMALIVAVKAHDEATGAIGYETAAWTLSPTEWVVLTPPERPPERPLEQSDEEVSA